MRSSSFVQSSLNPAPFGDSVDHPQNVFAILFDVIYIWIKEDVDVGGPGPIFGERYGLHASDSDEADTGYTHSSSDPSIAESTSHRPIAMSF